MAAEVPEGRSVCAVVIARPRQLRKRKHTGTVAQVRAMLATLSAGVDEPCCVMWQMQRRIELLEEQMQHEQFQLQQILRVCTRNRAVVGPGDLAEVGAYAYAGRLRAAKVPSEVGRPVLASPWVTALSRSLCADLCVVRCGPTRVRAISPQPQAGRAAPRSGAAFPRTRDAV